MLIIAGRGGGGHQLLTVGRSANKAVSGRKPAVFVGFSAAIRRSDAAARRSPADLRLAVPGVLPIVTLW
jgi:hypothetical protein